MCRYREHMPAVERGGKSTLVDILQGASK